MTTPVKKVAAKKVAPAKTVQPKVQYIFSDVIYSSIEDIKEFYGYDDDDLNGEGVIKFENGVLTAGRFSTGPVVFEAN